MPKNIKVLTRDELADLELAYWKRILVLDLFSP